MGSKSGSQLLSHLAGDSQLPPPSLCSAHGVFSTRATPLGAHLDIPTPASRSLPVLVTGSFCPSPGGLPCGPLGWAGAATPHTGWLLPTGSQARRRPAPLILAGLAWLDVGSRQPTWGEGRCTRADRQMDRLKQTLDKTKLLPILVLGLGVTTSLASPPTTSS